MQVLISHLCDRGQRCISRKVRLTRSVSSSHQQGQSPLSIISPSFAVSSLRIYCPLFTAYGTAYLSRDSSTSSIIRDSTARISDTGFGDPYDTRAQDGNSSNATYSKTSPMCIELLNYAGHDPSSSNRIPLDLYQCWLRIALPPLIAELFCAAEMHRLDSTLRCTLAHRIHLCLTQCNLTLAQLLNVRSHAATRSCAARSRSMRGYKKSNF